MTRAETIDYYLEKLSQPGFQFHQIRHELEARNIDEEEIQIIVRLIDNEIQRRMLTKASNKAVDQFIWLGAILSGLGAIVTIGTYTRMINTGNYYIIAWGPFLAGLSIVLIGLAKRKTN